MSRAALLPTPGDPFLLKFWFFMFEKRWQEEVDKLYVCLNSRIEKPVVEFIRSFMEKNPKVQFTYIDHMIEHGNAIKLLLNQSQEDLIMLIEDDGIIFTPGAVKEQFDRIEKGEVDLIGSQRQSSTPNIAEAAQKKFNLFTKEAFFWPNFLFTKREDLLKTDQNFGRADNFKQGEYIKELDWYVDGPVGADTFVWASIQLRAMGLKVDLVDQYHAMAEDMQFFEKKIRAWSGEAKWCHLGSLSSMMTNFLFDDAGFPLESRKSSLRPPTIDPFKIPQPENQQDNGPKQDLESRVANCLLAWEKMQEECEEITEFRDQYRRAIDRLISSFELSIGRIRDKIQAYKILYTLHV
jgi:hypothetical protein